MAAPELPELPPELAQMLQKMAETVIRKVAQSVPRLACSACARSPRRRKTCPFCLCRLDAQLPPGALDAVRLG
jgi:hypothetical protein